MKLRHVCEVCHVEAALDSDAAFDLGWDYPPRMGAYGILSPRTCPDCPTAATVWAAIALHGKTADDLTGAQRSVIERIAGEPESIMVTDGE